MRNNSGEIVVQALPPVEQPITLSGRSIYLNKYMDSVSVTEVITKMLELDSKSNEEITLFINSYGGSVYEGIALISTMKSIKSPVRTVVLGVAFSMAFIVFLTGSKRELTKYAKLMYHELSSGMFGKLEDFRDSIRELEDLQKLLDNIIVDHTKLTHKDLDKIGDKDKFFEVDEAIKYGIADNIIDFKSGLLNKPKVKMTPRDVAAGVKKLLEDYELFGGMPNAE